MTPSLRARRGHESDMNAQGGLAHRAQALERALELGGEQLQQEDAAQARTVLRRYRERFGLSGDYTVVALAGSTGAGKSSLFNALVGAEVSQASVRRPTTSRTNAAVWSDSMPSELLDWLGVATRHQVKSAELNGLILLDLPDFDSRELKNRAEADRVLALVDAYVWVTDPQKYADAIWHEEYLGRIAGSQAASLSVINQSDRLKPDDVPRVRDDLARLLRAGGEANPLVIPTSAKAEGGTQELLDELAALVKSKNAAARRAAADVTSSARALSSSVGAPQKARPHVTVELLDALEHSAGVNVALDALERDYIRECSRETGSPFTRFLHRLRPDPLKRLRLDTRTEADVALGRTGLPPASPVARAEVELQQNRVADSAGEHLPEQWRDLIHELRPEPKILADHLDQAVARVPLKAPHPAWWRIIGLLQWLFAGLAVVGAAWLIFLAAAASVQIHLQAPTFGSWLPIPLCLFVLGAGLSFALAVLMRRIARTGGRRARARAEQKLRASIEHVAQDDIMNPLNEVIERHNAVARELALAGE